MELSPRIVDALVVRRQELRLRGSDIVELEANRLELVDAYRDVNVERCRQTARGPARAEAEADRAEAPGGQPRQARSS